MIKDIDSLGRVALASNTQGMADFSHAMPIFKQ